MHKRKYEDKLIRFVWSRKIEYDYLLLLEVQARNPFSFKKPKPVWDDIATALRESELKMKVTDRSCRERVGELLKRHRKEEREIVRSTGATEDELTELKKLLIIVNEMALTKPDETDSSIYHKKNKKDGDCIRDAALKELSDTDSDDYIHNNSRNKSRPDEEFVTDINGLFPYDDMTLEEERLMDEESWKYAESLESTHKNQPSVQSSSWKDMPSSSRDNRNSIPEADLQSINVDDADGDSAGSERNKSTQGSSLSTVSMHKVKKSAPPNKKFSNQKQDASTSNNRFSNPKKDLIQYLERKSENEIDLRKEEIIIRRIELHNKQEELEILRLKTVSEAEEKKMTSGNGGSKQERRIRNSSPQN